MNIITEDALRELIISEKNNVDFFRHAARIVRDDRIRQVLEQLACDGIGYINVYYMVYQGSDRSDDFKNLLKSPPNPTYPPYRTLIEEVDMNTCEKQTLEISMRELLACIKFYTPLANSFLNHRLCSLYKRALRKAYRHYEIIHAEYIRIIGLLYSSAVEVPVRG